MVTYLFIYGLRSMITIFLNSPTPKDTQSKNPSLLTADRVSVSRLDGVLVDDCFPLKHLDLSHTSLLVCPKINVRAALGMAKRPTLECFCFRGALIWACYHKGHFFQSLGRACLGVSKNQPHGVCFLSSETSLLNWYENL